MIFGETLKVNVDNPATSQLFTITSEAKDFDDEKKERYQSITAKFLWIMKLSRTDMEMAVSSLRTRVQCPTEEDWGGLRRVLMYLKGGGNDKRIIGSKTLIKL